MSTILIYTEYKMVEKCWLQVPGTVKEIMSSPGFPMDALHSFGFYRFFRELCRLVLLLIYLYTLFVSYYDQQQDHHPTRRLRDQNVIALGLNFTKSNYYCHLRYFPFFLVAERLLSTSCLYETLFTKQYAHVLFYR